MKPTQREVIEMVRAYYGLTLQEAISIMKIPFHPQTMRDEFAGQALAGVTSNPESGCNSPSDLAHWAYRCADAIDERKDQGMKLVHSKSTYEISLDEVKALIAKQLNVNVERVQLNPTYGWPEDDGYGHFSRNVAGFEVEVMGE